MNDRGQVAGLLQVQHPDESPSVHAALWDGGTLRDLGTLALGGGADMPNASDAVALNDGGEVVGSSFVSSNDPEHHAVVWRAGGIVDLGPGFARAINERGEVAGSTGGFQSGEGSRAALWRDGRRIDLGSVPGRPYSEAVAVSDDGVVIGTAYAVGVDFEWLRMRGFVWQDGVLRDLGEPAGDALTEPRAINEAGQVIGYGLAGTDDPSTRAFLWDDGTLVELGLTEATDINDRGEVVGTAPTPSGAVHAFRWLDGQLTDLGTLGGDRSSAVAIDEHGLVVGSSTTASGAEHAFVWQNGRITDLGPGTPIALNERGQILGATAGGGTVLWSRASAARR